MHEEYAGSRNVRIGYFLSSRGGDQDNVLSGEHSREWSTMDCCSNKTL